VEFTFEMLSVGSARFAPVRALSYRSVVTLTCAKAEAGDNEVRKIRKVLTQNHDLPETVRVGNPRLDNPLETCSEQPGIKENNLRKAIVWSSVIGWISALCMPNSNLSVDQPEDRNNPTEENPAKSLQIKVLCRIHGSD